MGGCGNGDQVIQFAPAFATYGLAGWMLLALYVGAGAVVVARVRREFARGSGAGGRPRLWLVIAIWMALLIIDQAFGLEALVTLAVKCAAVSEGWYGLRRPAQLLAVQAAVGVGILTAIALFAFRRALGVGAVIALAGCALLSALVLAHAASLHDFDRFLRAGVAGLTLNGLIEAALLGLVIAGARFGMRY